jgi:probable rRNA maturation factor
MEDQSKKRAQLHYSTSPIQFNFIDYVFTLRNKTILRQWLIMVCKKEKVNAVMLSYNFCSDKFLLDINKKHLSHNYLTDIITFSLSDKKQEIVGDFYISIERVRQNAKTYNCPPLDELHRVLVHGLLHLCGYNDKTKKQALEMRKKEDEYLSLRPKKLNMFHVKHNKS